MSETKWYRAPWKAEETPMGTLVVRGPDGTSISVKGGRALIVSLGKAHGTKSATDRKWANAHLIAAAPELYEALERAAQKLGELWVAMPRIVPDFKASDWALEAAYDEARAALAKARGESQ